jgi:endoglucanase
MTYYCHFLVSETKKRGISTFIGDNNPFGSGPEHFGIFDRKAGMKVKADWILKGIFE